MVPPPAMRILSGVQPSGALHLGNYLGAVQQYVALQAEHEVFLLIADWHALTTLQDGSVLTQRVHDLVLDYLALGIDPERAVIFRQSDILEHTALAWLLATVTPMALLERAHGYKDKVARGKAASVGLFTYPILMAADILLYQADGVPVGPDQRQHLEIARDVATKFNVAFVAGYDVQRATTEGGAAGVFRLPTALISDHVAQVPGLDGQKMSKSYNNTLDVFAPAKETRKKIMRMPTDSTPVEAPKPAASPLLSLLKLLASPGEAARLEESWLAGGVGYGAYKAQLADLFEARFAPAAERRAQLAADPRGVEPILAAGAERARQVAQQTFRAAEQATGTGPRLPQPSQA